MSSLLLQTFQKKKSNIPPIWLMRQAGRYLPEYRVLRSHVPSFMEMCFTPPLATQVTLQPLKRFNLDAAILFSDILVLPHALGQTTTFIEGKGPVLAPLTSQVFKNKTFLETLTPVFETIENVRSALSSDKALIGFSGAPWTLATYMVEEGKSQSFSKVLDSLHSKRLFPLLDHLTHCVLVYLEKQIQAGVDVVQLFDSWAGIVPSSYYDSVLVNPLVHIATSLHRLYPHVPILYYGRGVSLLYPLLKKKCPFLSFSLDETVEISWAQKYVQDETCVVQGNLSPHLLLEGGEKMKEEAKKILEAFSQGPHIFNLGHGVLPQTPPEHVQDLIDYVRQPSS